MPSAAQTAQRLGDQRVDLDPQRGVRAERPHRQPGQRGQRRGRRVEDHLVPLRPAGVGQGMAAEPGPGQQGRELRHLVARGGLRLERPEPGVPRCVEPHHAGRGHRARGQDRAADHPRHQLGEDLLVAEPVLHAGDGRVGEHVGTRRHGGPRVLGLGRDDAQRARRHVGRRRPRVDRRDEGDAAGHPQPVLVDRGDVVGPGVDRPHLDVVEASQVRGVQRPDRAAADDADPGHAQCLGGELRAGLGAHSRPRRAATAVGQRHAAGQGDHRDRQHVLGGGDEVRRVAAGPAEEGSRRGDALGDVRRGRGCVVRRRHVNHLAAAVHHHDGDRLPGCEHPVGERDRTVEPRLTAGGRDRPEEAARSWSCQAPYRASQRGLSSPCWPTYGVSRA